MDSYVLVRSEHLNHNERLFGGQLLKWVDEYAYIAAKLDFSKNAFVTRAMENSEFKVGVPNGSLLRFHTEKIHQGKTSVTYAVDVYSEINKQEKLIFSNKVTLVAIDILGNKTALIVE
ncbi:MAG: acyl-CoA thioesterase [Spirochaetaceae bacterium]|nr:acyl-CoA thioesterase [Spirochaetaceae bacterium]